MYLSPHRVILITQTHKWTGLGLAWDGWISLNSRLLRTPFFGANEQEQGRVEILFMREQYINTYQHLQLALPTVKFLQIANLKSKSASLPSSDCAISGKNKGVIWWGFWCTLVRDIHITWKEISIAFKVLKKGLTAGACFVMLSFRGLMHFFPEN